MIGAADTARQSDLFTFETFHRFVLRRGLQPIGNPVRGKPDGARRQAREGRRHRSRTDAGNVIDLALGHGGGADGRAHDDDFHVQAIGFESSPVAGGKQRQRSDR